MRRPEKESNRKAAALPESLNKRLAVYALAATAAGVGVLALAPQAHADIVVTTESPALVINSTHTPETIAINGKSVLSFSEGLGHDNTVGIFVGVLNGAKVLAFNSFGASNLVSGGAIGPGGNFRSKSREGFPLNMGGTHSGVSFGRWNGAENEFLGFEFKSNAKTYFGWAQMSFSAKGKSAVLTEYAYDDVAGQTIDAGQKQLPATAAEPGTLSLLALGALGLLEFRRRRVAQRS